MQISYGLHQLHGVRIVHRDLKGENVLLDKSSDAKVADFGLSVVKSSSANQSKKSERAGAAGTLPWMAPELFDRKPNSPATDIYSLGVVLWEILSRQTPFAEVMPVVIMGMVLIGKRETLPEKCPEIFRLMITACWDADSQKRPTAETVGDQFEAALKSLESVPAIVSGEGKQPDRRELEESRKKRMLVELELKKVSNLPKEPATPVLQNRELVVPKLESKPAEGKALEQLLRLVAEGEQDKAEALIQKDRNLLLHTGNVTDLSGREFKSITVFQYALWALDCHMWKMVQKYLPEKQQKEQFTALESQGTAHGKHFKLKPLISILQRYLDKADQEWHYDQTGRKLLVQSGRRSAKAIASEYDQRVLPGRSYF